MDRRSRPGPEPTTLEAVGDQWRYALVVVQADDDDDDEATPKKVSQKKSFFHIGMRLLQAACPSSDSHNQ